MHCGHLKKSFKRKRLIWFLIFGVPLLATVAGLIIPNPFFPNKEAIQAYLDGFGIWGRFIFVGMATIPVIVTPLNHAVFALAGGYIFGPFEGTLLVWASKVIGTIVNFYIGRLIGNLVINRLASSEDLRKYNRLISSRFGLGIVFLVYFVPFLSNDNLTYLIGASSLRARTFIPLSLVAHVGNAFGLAYIGSGYSLTNPWFICVSVVFVGLFILVVRLKRIAVANQDLKY